jgi:hypothetical protein
MGLIASIYKDKGRSYSNGGISQRVDAVTIVNIAGPFEPTPERPAVMLVHGNLPGTVKIVPAVMATPGEYEPDQPTGKVGPMHGGCIVSTSDSRLGEAIASLGGPRFVAGVALHDRFETPEEYRALSI